MAIRSWLKLLAATTTAALETLDNTPRELSARITAVLRRLAGGHPISRIDDLLPWNFNADSQPASVG